MQGGAPLGGPVWLFAVVLFVSAFVFAVFTAVDPWRARRAERFAEVPEPRWLYSAPSALYLLVAIGVQFLPDTRVAVGVTFATPALIALGLTYLLRVVFPPAR